MNTTVLLWTAAAVLVAAGFAGLVLPVLPGPPLILAGLIAAAWAEGFTRVGPATLAVLGLMAALSWAVDFWAGAYGAKRHGATGRGVAGALLGTLVGVFFGLPGIVLGPFAGAVIGELWARRGLAAAGRAGIGVTLGLLLGTAAKLALAAAMIGTFLLVRFLSPPP